MEIFSDTIGGLISTSGFMGLDIRNIIMILLSFVLFFLAIVKKYEPLLMLPIAFGMLLTNLPFTELYHAELWNPATNPYFAPEYIEQGANVLVSFTKETSLDYGRVLHDGGLLDLLYLGVKLQIFPPLIFLGIGTMTDFGPLLANPKTALLGGAAQFGIFGALLLALCVFGFTMPQAASIGIIGGADGPTSIYVTSKLAPELLGAIAVAAYSYMALVPVIQPPIMKLLTTKAERQIEMTQLREVSQREKIVFPLLVLGLCILLLPDACPLIGALAFGNLCKESGVVERLSKTLQNELINIVTIFLGLSVGSKLSASQFLTIQTLFILILGIVAFGLATAMGVIFAKIMNKCSKTPINPLIGAAGVSAVPMAARVVNKVGLEYNQNNYLLMHAMGPNVSGVIGSAVAAGVLLALCH